MPLKIIVVGAGLGGLCAAVALRRAGHSVVVFEKSRFASEIGAALTVAPNGALVLASLGFSFERAQACRLQTWDGVDGVSLDPLSSIDFSASEEKYGAAFMAVHRVDLHNELLRLATEGEDNPVSITLRATVRNASRDGVVELEDGSRHHADLVVGADGLHSATRASVLGVGPSAPEVGLSAFRFLIPTKKLNADPSLDALLKWKAKGGGVVILVDTADRVNERHAVWYECHGGNIQNMVGIHPTRANPVADEDYKESLLAEFGHFHPDIVRLLSLAEDVKCWPLASYKPLPTWTYGNVILIGDAAHPMLPFGGQAANQAFEDGGALGYLMQGVEHASEIPKRLSMFESVRLNRASIVQTLSSVRIGREKEVEDTLRAYAEDANAMPTTFAERIEHGFNFNVIDKCQQILSA